MGPTRGDNQFVWTVLGLFIGAIVLSMIFCNGPIRFK